MFIIFALSSARIKSSTGQGFLSVLFTDKSQTLRIVPELQKVLGKYLLMNERILCSIVCDIHIAQQVHFKFYLEKPHRKGCECSQLGSISSATTLN